MLALQVYFLCKIYSKNRAKFWDAFKISGKRKNPPEMAVFVRLS